MMFDPQPQMLQLCRVAALNKVLYNPVAKLVAGQPLQAPPWLYGRQHHLPGPETAILDC